MIRNLVFYVIITLGLLIPFKAKAWQKVEYKVTYDDNFQPTATVKPANNGQKTITSIQFVILSTREGSDRWDATAMDCDRKIVTTTIQPGYVNTITFPIKLRSNYRFKDIAIEKVRFSDGTIKEY